MAIRTKITCLIKLLFGRVEAVQYTEVKEGMRRLHPDLLNWTIDNHKVRDDMDTVSKLEE